MHTIFALPTKADVYSIYVLSIFYFHMYVTMFKYPLWNNKI